MASQDDVSEVHDLHVWEVTSGFPAVSAHILVHADCDCHGVRRNIERMLHDQFDLEHTTLQVDHTPHALLSIDPASQRRSSAEHEIPQD